MQRTTKTGAGHGHGITTSATRLAAIALSLMLTMPALAQSPFYSQLPPPVDLGIQNIPQDTAVWCWAAVAQQLVLASRGTAGTPPQCGMVAIASNLPPAYCCQNPTPCLRTGSLQEIQGLILHFGGHYSSIAPPVDPMTLYHTLAAGRAIIMVVQSSPFAGHVIVIRGLSWQSGPYGVQPMLLVNDPMSHFTQTVPYAQLLPCWSAAIVVN